MTQPDDRASAGADTRSFPWPWWLATTPLVVLSAWVLERCCAQDLARFFGPVPASLALVAVVLAGVPATYVWHARHGFRLAYTRSGSVARAVLLALPFILVVTMADLGWRFPSDMNVPPPGALLFYPVMGFVVEIEFRAVPLALLLPLAGRLSGRWSAARRTAVVVLIVASAEAAVQTAFAIADGGRSALVVFVAIHLFAFGLVELLIYRRDGFVAMVVFRLTYYVWWHLAWGVLRLQWLTF